MLLAETWMRKRRVTLTRPRGLRQAAALSLGLLAAHMAQGADDFGPLIAPETVMAQRDDWVVLDIRWKGPFTPQGFIPGARRVWLHDILATREVNGETVRRYRVSPETFEAVLQRAGVDRDAKIVVTSSARSPFNLAAASRLYWHLKLVGHDRVALLDGGNAAWKALGGDLVTEPSAPGRRGDFRAKDEDPSLVAETAQVVRASETRAAGLVEARGRAEYEGWLGFAGHIPGARLLANQTVAPGGGYGRFESPDRIDALAQAAGLAPDRPAIAYCNSGVYSSVVWFALHEIAGRAEVANYDGSMMAWTADPARPVTRGAQP